MYSSPHHGPAAHHSAPIQTSLFACIYCNIPLTASWHCAFTPPPNSPRNPFLPFVFSHCVAFCMRSRPMLALTHSSAVPDPSESRYWCIS